MATAKTKLYLINGSLGSGKTTLLKHLLSTPEFADARVVENEFASHDVDAEQLARHREEVRSIVGVCICCSTGRELAVTLEELAETSDKPVVLEGTGVSNSLVLVEKLAASGLLGYYDLQHAVFVLDGVETLRRPELLDIHHEELVAADIVLLSKTDLLEPEDTMEIMRQLTKRQITRVESMYFGEIDPALLNQPSGIVRYFHDHEDVEREHDMERSFIILTTSQQDVSPERVREVWSQFVELYGAERMKGAISYEGQLWHVEATPAQCRITESDLPQESLSLVVIGSDVERISETIFMA